ncbi:MAG: DUF2156 domain-containing protein [Deltaproteobacteria bacterium]|nr:DUF2156 domain-containing protein [Deltaproteobacteria bacterium]
MSVDAAHQLALRHGRSFTALQAVGKRYRYFFAEDGAGDGCVAYVDTGWAWVVAGAPWAPTDKISALTLAFIEAARRAGRRCCFFATEAAFVHASAAGLSAFRIGELPVWNPADWPSVLKQNARLREQLRRARAKGVRIEALPPNSLDDRALRTRIDELSARWLATRKMPAMGFLVEMPDREEANAVGRCGFAAYRGDALVGFAWVIDVPARSGYFIEHLVRCPSAPNGTVELLVDAVMKWAIEQDSTWLTLGLSPLSGDVPHALRFFRENSGLLYDFEGLWRFKGKLRPTTWVPVYVSHPKGQSAILTIIDVLAAFAKGGFLRFSARILGRGSSAAIAVLGVLLIPWIGLLLAAPADAWFAGHRSIKWGWIGFDVMMMAALLLLARRPSSRLASILAAAATLDALVTPIEALAWNLPRMRGWFDLLIVFAGCVAPPVAALVLFYASRRLRSLRPRPTGSRAQPARR